MEILLTIREGRHGLWCIWRGNTCLQDGLHLAAAIKQARNVARQLHGQSGQPARVDMVSEEFTIPLAAYASQRVQAVAKVA